MQELESPQKAEPAPISKGRKYIGLHMNRREAVNSVLTNFLTVPQKTASLLVEAWDARQSVCLIVSERAAQNLFVRSFLFHVSFLVTATADDHVRKYQGLHIRAVYLMVNHAQKRGAACCVPGLCTKSFSRIEYSVLQCGSWDNHRPNVQGLAALESGLSKNRLGPSDGPSFRVKWECFGLYCKSLFTDLADRDKEVSINHFPDGANLPPVRGFLHTWNASCLEATITERTDMFAISMHTVFDVICRVKSRCC